MTDKGVDAPMFERAIVADELGIEYGVYGEYRIRNMTKAAFACDGVTVVPAAMETFLVPYRHGHPATFAEFFDTVRAQDRRLVAEMLGMLQLANHRQLCATDMALIFSMEAPARSETAARVFEKLAFMTAQIELGSIRASRLICHIAAAQSTRQLLAAADRMRALGIRVALRLGGADQPDANAIEIMRPDLVRIDRTLIAQACRDKATIHLFHSVVAGIQDQGMTVLVEGIETEHHLDVAIASQADLLQGRYLQMTQPVGMVIDMTARALSALRPREGVVVPLFG